ncbi:uncharacterized protein BKA78DRAFT_13490 [Phyllosticta capitalensis]|uniref:uncharacterized protein n=1 Tax=Phyllosticta capitalensis TaxID=121624 RepID=UPI00312F031A
MHQRSQSIFIDSVQVSVAVSAVVSAFNNGAGLLHAVRKSRVRRRRGEEGFKEKVLLESLLSGEKAIDEHYAALCKEFGKPARAGDAIARDRLLHVAVSMQPEVIRSLQIATRNDSAILDFTKLHEASVMLRRDAIEALADFRQRLAEEHPSSPTIPPYSTDRSLSSSQNSMSSPFQRSRSSSYFSCADVPPTVTILQGDEQKPSRLSRVFSRRTSNSARSSVKPARGLTRMSSAVNLPSNNQSWVSSHKADENQDMLSPLPQEVPQDVPAEVPPRRRPLMDPLPAPPPPPAYSPRRRSRYIGLDEKASEPVPPRPEHPLEREERESEEQDDAEITPEPEAASRQDSAMPSPGDVKSTDELDRAFTDVAQRLNMRDASEERPHSWVSSSASASSASVYSTEDSIQPDNTTVASTAYTSSHHSPSGSRTSEEVKSVAPYNAKSPPLARHSYTSIVNSTPYSQIPVAPPAPIHPVKRPSTIRSIRSIRSYYGGHRHATSEPAPPVPQLPTSPLSSFFSKPFVGPRMQDGPSKQNGYYNFCKGAWGLREDFKKGLAIHAKPLGMYTSAMVWKCKCCAFEGPAWVKSKPYRTDPNVYTFECRVPTGPNSSSTMVVNIRYKWIFLAKSHVKVKQNSLFRRSTLSASSLSAGYSSAASNPHVQQNLVLRAFYIPPPASAGTSVSHRNRSRSRSRGRSPSMPSLMAAKAEQDPPKQNDRYLRKSGHNFGCIFCCAEGRVTSVFGNLELMLRHVAESHAQPGVLTVDVMERTKCVAGRSPGPGEECDVWWTTVEQDS